VHIDRSGQTGRSQKLDLLEGTNSKEGENVVTLESAWDFIHSVSETGDKS